MAEEQSERLSVPENVHWCEVRGEAVLLDASSGTYFGLNAVGARMWELLSQHGEIDEVVGRMVAEFEVGEERLRADLEALVEGLVARGLLRVGASEAG